MSHANPTALRIGMSGVLDGRKYTVLGRVVYGVQIESETYYWQEFYLGDMAGQTATLVFEETENGPTWKFFKRFQPAAPFSVRDAGTKRRGEGISLTGQPARVTLIGVSKVCYIEGDGPAGVAVGDVDNYFNAETAKRMMVVSWRGEKIEFFEGRDLPRGTVEAVFGLPPPRREWQVADFFEKYTGRDWEELQGVALFVVIMGVIVLAQFEWTYDPGVVHPEPPPKLAAPEPRLPVGAHGLLGSRDYTITGYALAEVAQVGKRFDRHEYLLVDERGERALLIQGLRGGIEWRLFKLASIASSQAPYESAHVRQGFTVEMGTHKLPVTHLFLETARNLEGTAAGALWSAKILHGYVAGSGDDWVICRWAESDLWVFSEGHAVGQATVLTAFKPTR